MPRLIFVHGMRQEGKDPDVLRDAWEDALHAAWTKAGLSHPSYELSMPFYGDLLDELTREARGADQVVTRGPAAAQMSPDKRALLLEYGEAFGIGAQQVRARGGDEVVARGPANWEWVQAIARAIERRVPLFGTIGLEFVRQVEAYLTRPHIQEAVDEIVRPQLLGGPAIVVSHSLGTIISYRLLREAGSAAQVPLFFTLGSPLGLGVVKNRIKPPKLALPEGVARWVNGTDERDYVALHARLDETSFAADIENLADVQNSRADAHSIVEYLSDHRVARIIHEALLR